MKIAITGTQTWGDHAQAAEEIVAGFVSKLPRNSIIITLGEDDGPGVWAGKYARAYRFHITELAPQQVKGAAAYVKNFSQRDKNVAEQAERLFCFLYAPAELEPEIASLMTVIRLQHVAYTVYTLAPDEEDSEKLKLTNIESVEPKQMLAEQEVKKVESGKGHRNTALHRKPAARNGHGTDKVRKTRTAGGGSGGRTKSRARPKSIVLTRRPAVSKVKPRADGAASPAKRAGAVGKKQRVGKGKEQRPSKTIILKRI